MWQVFFCPRDLSSAWDLFSINIYFHYQSWEIQSTTLAVVGMILQQMYINLFVYLLWYLILFIIVGLL